MVLTNVCDTRDCWTFELCPSSGILKNSVSETGSFSVLRCESSSLLGPLQRANLSHWKTCVQPSSVNCCWSPPAQSFLVSGPVGTQDHIFVLSRPLRGFKWGLLFDERRGLDSLCQYNSSYLSVYSIYEYVYILVYVHKHTPEVRICERKITEKCTIKLTIVHVQTIN
jgi:hypothetical protein